MTNDDVCPRCAAATDPHARFCRHCGQSLTPAAETRDEPAPASETRIEPAPAPSPGETRIEAARATAAAPPSPAARPRRRGLLAVALIAGVLAVFAGAAAGTYLLLGADEDTAPPRTAAAQPRSVTPTPTPTPTPRARATPAATVTVTPGDAITGGRYVRLGSFRFEKAARRTADDLRAKGVDAVVIASDDAVGMFPAFFQVVQGPLASEREERRALRAAERAGVAGPFVRPLMPAESGRLDPGALAGDFRGTLQQTNAKVQRLNRKLATTMSFAPDGLGGTVTYDRPACEGTLSLKSRRGRVLAYGESITAGRCSDSGTWYLRLDGDELLATWWRDDDVTFVIGTLER